MKSFDVLSKSPEETRELARRLAPLLAGGDVINLGGDLGAGKTCFTQGLAKGLGVNGRVQSPTFTLMRVYSGRLPLYHFDFYRLESEELAELGFEEFIYGDGAAAIEWGRKAAMLLPYNSLTIDLEILEERTRSVKITPHGARWARIVREWLD